MEENYPLKVLQDALLRQLAVQNDKHKGRAAYVLSAAQKEQRNKLCSRRIDQLNKAITLIKDEICD